MALEKPDAFFTFLDRLTDAKGLALSTSMTPEAIHQAALRIALDDGILQETGSLSAVEMNLALHAATPKLEAFYNHYEDYHNHSRGTQCGSWVDWYGEVVCNADRLAQLVGIDSTSDLKMYVLRLSPFFYTHKLELPFQVYKQDQKSSLLITYFHLPILLLTARLEPPYSTRH